MNARACILPALATLVLGSCTAPPTASDRYRLDPLAFRQRRAYAEAVGGRFVSLADFEDAPGTPGYRQINDFSVVGGDSGGSRSFTVNVTATGSGAMGVLLHPGAKLRFDLPDIRNFTGYTLLSVAIHSRQLRDDLEVSLSGPAGEWTSSRRLLRPGWNTVMVDLRKAAGPSGFPLTDVRAIHLRFTDAADDVRFELDDVLLIDNRREISPVPEGIALRKEGLDYLILLPGRDDALWMSQSPDGLWRLGDGQAMLTLGGGDGEQLDVLGDRRIGHVELIEHNSVRVRLVSTWYFPDRPGAWVSMAMRKVRWEHTLYGDGRWVCSVEVDAAGAEQFSGLRIRLPSVSAVAGIGLTDRIDEPDFSGPSARWSWLEAAPGGDGGLQRDSYLSKQVIQPSSAPADSYAPGDVDRDGFDESQGCFAIFAQSDRCGFIVKPAGGPLVSPVFRVIGRWSQKPVVTVAGMRIRRVLLLDDGSVLFVVPGLVKHAAVVEVAGTARAENISSSNGDP